MEGLFDMKLKKDKSRNIKILFVSCISKNYDNTIKNGLFESMKEYRKLITENKDLYVIMDARNIEMVSPKLAWESASEIIKFNDIARENIKASSILLTNKNVINLINMITKIHPFVNPTKVCKTNEEAMDFINKKNSSDK